MQQEKKDVNYSKFETALTYISTLIRHFFKNKIKKLLDINGNIFILTMYIMLIFGYKC